MPRKSAERLRAICLALPDATEAPMRRGPTYRIANKIFAMERPQDDALAVVQGAARQSGNPHRC
jgi:hypothetical protein